MLYDESTYPSPYTFDPERYLTDGKLDPTVKDPGDRIFGSGRRCEFSHHGPVLPSTVLSPSLLQGLSR